MQLTKRLEQVRDMLLTDANPRYAAHQMGISPETFKVYCSKVFAITGCETRYELMGREIQRLRQSLEQAQAAPRFVEGAD